MNQRRFRKHKSAWATEAKHLLRTVFGEAHGPGNTEYDLPHEGVGEQIAEEYEEICKGLHLKGDTNVDLTQWASGLPVLLCPPYWHCPYCDPKRPLFKLDNVVKVPVITHHFNLITGFLVTAQCTLCHAHFFPDCITRILPGGDRHTNMLVATEYLQVSRKTLWVHCCVAQMQEVAFLQFHASAGVSRHFSTGELQVVSLDANSN